MNEKTDIPKGFKLTKSGIIPDEWDALLGKELFTHRKQKGYEGLTTFSVTINSGLIERNSLDRKMAPDLAADKSLLIETDDLAYNMMRMWQGSVGIAQTEGVVSPAYVVIRCKKGFNPQFAFYLLKSTRYLHLLKSYSHGITEDRLRLYFQDFSLIQFVCPNHSEQQKIAEILNTWDQAISTTQKLINELKLRNKGLAQHLLTGKKRLKGFDGKWEEQHLERYFKERKETNHHELPLLSVGEIGVYPQTNSNKKDTSNEDKSKYKRICPGDIGYNTMRMWQGRSALSSLEGIVSPAYTIVTPKKNADAEFFAYLFKLDEVIHKFFRKSQGLVSDTLNCKFKDFKIVKVLTPPSIDEQKAITKVLQKANEELKLYQQKLDVLKEQKKGLMQKLLTGEIRVKTE